MAERATAVITALIVDDEQLACDELAYLLKDFPDIEVVGAGHNGLEAVEMIETLEPELVFLELYNHFYLSNHLLLILAFLKKDHLFQVRIQLQSLHKKI